MGILINVWFDKRVVRQMGGSSVFPSGVHCERITLGEGFSLQQDYERGLTI